MRQRNRFVRARKNSANLWGAKVPDTARHVREGNVHAPRNPANSKLSMWSAQIRFKTFGVERKNRDRRDSSCSCVHELFMTETAKHADVIFPAASVLRKKRHRHQYRRRSPAPAARARSGGRALRFRFAAHSFASTRETRTRQWRDARVRPKRVFEEIRANVAGYDVAMPALLSGAAALARAARRREWQRRCRAGWRSFFFAGQYVHQRNSEPLFQLINSAIG